MGGKIQGVLPDSVAQELGLEVGDELLSINGEAVRDLIDYNYHSEDEYLELEIRKANGEIWSCQVDKYAEEELGLEFTANVFDRIRPCANHCVFCFIDQLQPQPRPSLLLKDDDYRMSFMEGSFITCTNMREEDYRRISELHLSPLYISVHTVDPRLRGEMLGRSQPTEILLTLQRLISMGCTIQAQIVLCPGLNDGAALAQTLDALYALHPGVETVAVVPVGLTKYQKNPALRLFTPEEAAAIIDDIQERQARYLAEGGRAFVFAADELYVKAGRAFPPAGLYEDFVQIENGVGMAAHFLAQWQEVRPHIPQRPAPAGTAILTGRSGAAVLRPLVEELNRLSHSQVRLVEVENHFYGPSVTASGLLTGSDLCRAVAPGSCQRLLITTQMLKFDQDIFLDDMTAREAEERLGGELVLVLPDAESLLAAIFAPAGEE